MTKRTILFALLCVKTLIPFHMYATITHNVPKQSPEKIEMFFDMDDVLVHASKKELAKEAVKHLLPNATTILQFGSRICYEGTRWLFTRSKGKALELIDDIKELTRVSAGASGYAHALGKYEEKLGRSIRDIVRKRTPIQGMQALLAELKGLGYRLHIATNDGHDTYKELANKHPELFQYIDGGITGEYTKPGEWLHKPESAYFKKIKQLYNPQGDKAIIFIDDKEKNVNGAVQEGITGIRFSSPDQLRKELTRMGILPASSK